MLEKLAYVRLKIVDSPNPNILMEKIMCGVDRYDCAYGHCKECANRKMPTTNEYTEAVAATKVSYYQQNRDCRVERRPKECSKNHESRRDRKKPLKILKERYIKHVFNIKHQYRELKNMKDNLCESGCVILLDFSENYNGKLAEEIQTMHFGGNRRQISLHTVVVYVKDKTHATWNFTETGHGKSAADGVGGTVKRTADRIVANGKTINNATALFENDLDAESVEVKCMARIGHSRYFWPRIDDIIWYTWNHVMMPIPEPSHVRGRHCQIDPEKFKAIEAV
ncbi:hypothetical protein MAR_005679, partial [Mya arenaria]